jgi:phosphoribosylformylglycinamidine synthase
MEGLQIDEQSVKELVASQSHDVDPVYRLTFEPTKSFPGWSVNKAPEIAIIRDYGSNGDREMMAAFEAAGFRPSDVSINHLVRGKTSLERFRGVAFVGGFSHADVFGSGKGTASIITHNESLRRMFAEFKERSDTFSFGACNGNQIMQRLGWAMGIGEHGKSRVRLLHNRSGRFDAVPVRLLIGRSPAIMLRGMEDSILETWSAHGEGRFDIDPDAMEEIEAHNLAPVRYADYMGDVTEAYPHNPNGSPLGIAGLVSPCGRHFSMMPHPERSFLRWHEVYAGHGKKLQVAPWLRMFQNAYEWCAEVS